MVVETLLSPVYSGMFRDLWEKGYLKYSEFLRYSKTRPSERRRMLAAHFQASITKARTGEEFSVNGYVIPAASAQDLQSVVRLERESSEFLEGFRMARISPFIDSAEPSLPIVVPSSLIGEAQGYCFVRGHIQPSDGVAPPVLAVEEVRRARPEFKPQLDFNDVTNLLKDRYYAEDYIIEPLACLLFSSPAVYDRIGGIGSLILPSEALRERSLYLAQTLRKIALDLHKLAPPWFRRPMRPLTYSIGDEIFRKKVVGQEYALLWLPSYSDSARIIANRKGSKALKGLREASMTDHRGRISLTDFVQSRAEVPLPLSPGTFTLDEKQRELFEFSDTIFEAVMGFMQNFAGLNETPDVYVKKFDKWIEGQKGYGERRKYLIREGRLLDPNLGGRFEHGLRLACAYARGAGRDQVETKDIDEALWVEGKLIDLFEEAVPEKEWKELESEDTQVQGKKDRRILEMILDLAPSYGNEIPEDVATSEGIKLGYTKEQVTAGLESLIRAGEIYHRKPGFITVTP